MRRKRTRRQGRLWQQREARALEMMRFKQYASVLDIGRAAVRGESEAFAISLDGFGNIGRTVAESLYAGRRRAKGSRRSFHAKA